MKEFPSDPFLRGYLLVAMFANDTNPCSGEFTESGRPEALLSSIPENFLSKAIVDCVFFQADNALLLQEATKDSPNGGYDFESAGMDLWHSRNGHGVGFWSRDLGGCGNALHAAAKRMGERYWDLSRG